MNRILIVDDDAASVALLEAYLGDEASVIKTVTDSQHVEQAFLEFEPDIVLLDLHMPKPDGLEILSKLSSMRSSLGFLPVIVLTGDTGRLAETPAVSAMGGMSPLGPVTSVGLAGGAVAKPGDCSVVLAFPLVNMGDLALR